MGKESSLLKKFLKAAASDEETRKVETWLDSSAKSDNPWEVLGEKEKSVFLEELKKEIDRRSLSARKKTKRSATLMWSAVAAAIVIVALIPVYLLRMQPSSGGALPDVLHQRIVETNTGEIRQLQLSDGSRVWLNAKTRFRYTDSFGSKTRDVYLDGQAYFEIARDVKRPFVVHASSWQIKVLGTHFDVSDYKEDNEVAVSVLSGKVAVRLLENNATAAIISRGEQLDYNKKSLEQNRRMFSVADRPRWMNKDVVFYHTKMTEVANYINRNYGLEMTFSTPGIGDMEISGDFGKMEKAENLLEIICLTINAQYKIQGENAVISTMH